MIEVRNLTKRYGKQTAVEDLSFTVEGGQITGFLGPNGAGKSTTMRMILGLDRPQSGTATIEGRPYRELRRPLTVVGALLEASAAQGGRTGRDHMRWIAQSQGLPLGRVDELLDRVELSSAANRRIKGYSLGMKQRLGIATALLGDPRVLLLDEPVNGLDPSGVHWIRVLLKGLAAEGRAVLISSHLLNEMAVTADHLIVITRGRLVAKSSTEEFLARHSPRQVRVRTPDRSALSQAVIRGGGTVRVEDDHLIVTDLTAEQVADIATAQGIPVHELTPLSAGLEDAFLEVTS
jgi:ABC-2 type transport system ATP-binding protein